MVQGGSKFTDAIFTLPTPSGFVNVSFFSNHQSTFVSFNPGFNDGLSGTFYCHSTADFSVISPVSVTISPGLFGKHLKIKCIVAISSSIKF